MSYSIVGSCPDCGAPMYSPTVWGGTTPPPAQRSCTCGTVHISMVNDNVYSIEQIKDFNFKFLGVPKNSDIYDMLESKHEENKIEHQ